VQGARPYIYRGRAPCTKANIFIFNTLVASEKRRTFEPKKDAAICSTNGVGKTFF
jgi:hypothetical protein